MKSFYCSLCGEDVYHHAPEDNVYEGIQAATDHFRNLHPEVFATMQTWPDGTPVVVDETLTPQEFGASDDGTSSTAQEDV